MTNLTKHFSPKILRPWTVTLLPVDQLPGNKRSEKFLQLYLDELAGFQPISRISSLRKMRQFLFLHHHPYLPRQIPLVKFLQPLASRLQILKPLQPRQTHLGCTVSTHKFQLLILRKGTISTMFAMLRTSLCHKLQLQRISCHTSTKITSPHSSVRLTTAFSAGFTMEIRQNLPKISTSWFNKFYWQRTLIARTSEAFVQLRNSKSWTIT